jgi:hypothetical protein
VDSDTRFTVEVNPLYSDYTMCNARPGNGYSCVPEWNCACSDAIGGDAGGGGEECGCVAWGSGSMHNPDSAPSWWRNSSTGVGRNEVEAEWGSTGGGHAGTNCSVLRNETACKEGRHGGCSWEDSHCVDVFSVSTALTYAADKVGGYWFSTQGPGGNISWAVVSKAIANATCVNTAVNVVVDSAGAAACRK